MSTVAGTHDVCKRLLLRSPGWDQTAQRAQAHHSRANVMRPRMVGLRQPLCLKSGRYLVPTRRLRVTLRLGWLVPPYHLMIENKLAAVEQRPENVDQRRFRFADAGRKHGLEIGLFDRRRFGSMRNAASLVNLGRGGHVVEPDLLDALAGRHLRHAVLDVFDSEPLPPEHWFWAHPQVTVLPHIAALTDPHSAAEVVAGNVRALRSGAPLSHLVDRARGY